MSADAAFMERALLLAARGLYTTDPNPRVGCVLVKGADIVGEGWHERAGEPHAEANALRSAGERARGSTAYVSLEPCSHTGRTPPCANALIEAGVTRVVTAVQDPNPKVSGAGLARLRAAGIEVGVGVCETQARALNPGFMSRFERGRPFVRLKIAQTLDARTALRDGTSFWITGDAAREDVQRLRARSSAICTGSATIAADDPELGVRLNYGPFVRQPLRVLLDTKLTLKPTARVFRDANALVFAAEDAPADRCPPVPVERVARDGAGLALGAVLKALAAREVNELLVECGPTLAASFLRGGWVDELILYIAPKLFGEDARPMMRLQGLSQIESAPRFKYADVRQIGDDLRLTLIPTDN